MDDVYILGIESSCDETAAAVVRSGAHTESNVVLSQIATHAAYGGVVPELASREHLRGIVPVVRKALADAGQTYASIDAIAVTQGPGLAGALLVGVTYAKALAFALDKPLIAVNHLEGHIHAVLLEQKEHGHVEVKFPVLALVVSGGHTHLFLCKPLNPIAHTEIAQALQQRRSAATHDGSAQLDRVVHPQNDWDSERNSSAWSYQLIGRTRDDAAGEAYDKVAKLLGLGYPGGPLIDRLAKHGNPRAVKFSPAQIKGKDRSPPAGAQTSFDFSFSGIKTAVLRYVEVHAMQPAIEERREKLAQMSKPSTEEILRACDRQTLDLIASFQRAVVDDLVGKTLSAADQSQAATLFVTGGVAANSELRECFEQLAPQRGLPVYFPSRPLSTDNAAMIAAAAYPKFLRKDFAEAEFSAEAGLQLC